MVKQGEIFYLDFDPSKGHEEKKKRPAIVLSNDVVFKTSGMTIVAPISSTTRNFPMYYQLTSTKTIYGKVLLDQTVSLDLIARGISDKNIIDQVSKQELQEIIYLYKLLFSID